MPQIARSEILKAKRTAGFPDLTYDFDNDGVVSPREYVVGRRFDKNGDGRLEAGERKEALRALEEGYEESFVWGLDKSKPVKERRVLQVRGKVVDGDDFLPVSESYPRLLLSRNQPLITSLSELKIKRRKEIR
eukprot:TRINITY_DN10520_c0_g3_i1.p1 TRINITY_DN10520_c0_g3~~TRINITY_DN10520_c0_g3_i1.p1  ORF type:complete len:133 (-),score=41.61 TRINITY_DN10520_c0_g3_i1:121-519(-)